MRRSITLLALLAVGCTNEQPTSFSITSSVQHVDENAGDVPGVAQITLDAAPDETLDFFVSPSASDRVRTLESSYSFAPGETSASVGVSIVDNLDIEDEVAIDFTVDVPGLGTSDFSLIIDDDEGRGLVWSANATATEGDPISLRLQAEGRVTEPVEIALSATPSGRLQLPDSVTLGVGEQSVDIVVTPEDDELWSPQATTTLSATPTAVLDAPDDHVLTIEDDEPVTMTIEALQLGVDEGAGTVDLVRVTAASAASVDRTISAAVSPAEVATVPTEVTLPALATTVDIPVTLTDDTVLELDSVLGFTVTPPDGTPLTVDIDLFDDEVAALTLDSAATTLAETAGGTVELTIGTGVELGYDVTVAMAVSDDTEASVPVEVVIAAGDDEATATLTAVDDDWLDFEQDVTITATAFEQTALAAVTVTDDESNALQLDVADIDVYEDDGPLADIFEVSVAAPVESALTVDVSSGDPGQLQVQNQVTIAAGETSVGIDIYPLDDDEFDLDQTIGVTVSADGCEPDTNVLVVHDSDAGYVVELRQGVDVEQWIDFGPYPGLVYDTDWTFVERFLMPADPYPSYEYQLFRGSAFDDLPGDFGVKVSPFEPAVSFVFLPMLMHQGDGGVTLTQETWHTLAIRYSSDLERAALFVDGVFIDEQPSFAQDDRTNDNPLVFGGQWVDPANTTIYDLTGAVYNETDATLGHMAIWQRALSDTEIADYDGEVDLDDPAIVLSTIIGPGVVYDAVGDRDAVVHGGPLFYQP